MVLRHAILSGISIEKFHYGICSMFNKKKPLGELFSSLYIRFGSGRAAFYISPGT